MSIYFIIAIALSAMSAVTEVQVARPRLAHVQIVRAERRVIRVVIRRESGGAQDRHDAAHVDEAVAAVRNNRPPQRQKYIFVDLI